MVDDSLWTPDEQTYRRPEPTGRPTGTRPVGTRASGRDPAESPPRDPANRSTGSWANRRDPAESPPRDPAEQAREICLRQLAVRPRTRAELATAMRRRGIPDDVASSVLDRYDDVGLIDDAAFARAWVTSRHHGQGLARRALADELRRRGVDKELVGEALTEVDGETEAVTARALVERRLRTMGNAPPEAVLRRLVGMLARKGYPAGLSIGVVKEALANRADELASYAELLDPDAATDLVGEGGADEAR